MPFRKKFARKPFKKRRPFRKRSKLNIPKPIFKGRRVVQFRRSVPNTLVLDNSTPPEDWTAIGTSANRDAALVVNYSFALSEIPDYTDFTNLFDSYRIKGIRMVGYFSNTQSSTDSNSNLMLYYMQSDFGNQPTSALTEQFFLNRPATKKKILLNVKGGKVFDIYQPLTQLRNTYASVANTDYALAKPRFVSIGEINTPHYGMYMRLQRVDGNVFSTSTTSYPALKIVYTYYLQMRGVA